MYSRSGTHGVFLLLASHRASSFLPPFPRSGFAARPSPPPGSGLGTMKALTPDGLTRTVRSLRLLRLAVPTFRPQPRDPPDGRFEYQSPQRHPLFQASPHMSRLATRSRRNRFVILRTAGSPPVALHPALRRRSYLRFPGCDQPGHGLAPCRQSVLTDALMPTEVGIHAFASANIASRGWPESIRP